MTYDTLHLGRRTFLGAAALAAGSALVPKALGFNRMKLAAPEFKISLAQWSLHRAIFGKELDHMDFAAAAKNDYGVSAIEYVNIFFKDKAEDAAYLKEMNTRAKDLGVTQLLIMCDGEGAIGDPDSAKRSQAIDNHRKWLHAAKTLGCHSIRVNAQSSGTPDEQQRLAADGLRRLTELGAAMDLNVIVENHGGLSSNGAWLAGVMKLVDSPRCGTLPDFGNFKISETEMYDRYKGVGEMMPFAKAVSAKTHEFDAQGNEVHTDFRRMLKIVAESYSGYIGIEYEGDKHSEPDGIRYTKKLLETVFAEMATPAKGG
jgi:L-ribulose-5-phosphate 3-epimerase